jgi:hypothetical protein
LKINRGSLDYLPMKAIRSVAFFSLSAFSAVFAADSGEDVPLSFTRLDLTDGRKLKNVVVKSYDAPSQKLLLVTDGKAMTIPIALVPPPFNQQLKAAPASGSSVTTVAVRTPVVAAADQYQLSTPVPVRRSPSPQRLIPTPAPQPTPATANHPLLAPANMSAHEYVARARAEQYYRYEFRLGSSSTARFDLEIELGVPKPVVGRDGRFSTEGKAFILYYDPASRTPQRINSTFEVTTEQPSGEALKAIDFTRKS